MEVSLVVVGAPPSTTTTEIENLVNLLSILGFLSFVISISGRPSEIFSKQKNL